MQNETNPSEPVAEERTVALLSYLTIVGCVIGLILHSNKKTKLGAYHLRQGLGLALGIMGLRIILGFVPYGLFSYSITVGVGEVTWFLYVLLAVLGLIAASNGKSKPLPVVGALFEKWFAGTIEG
jgi:uncharacterized membrane protein